MKTKQQKNVTNQSGTVKTVVIIFLLIALVSSWYVYHTHIEKLKQEAQGLDSLEILKEENMVLREKLEGAPIEAVKKYIAQQKALADNRVVKEFNHLNYTVVGIDSVGIPNQQIKNLLTGDDLNYWDIVTDAGQDIKQILEDSPLLMAKIKQPQLMEKFYTANKNGLRVLMPMSKKMQKVYAGAGSLADYFDGHISTKRKKALNNYFQAHDGDGGKWIAWGEYEFDKEMKNDVTLKNLIAAYGGDKKLSNEHYLMYLSAKRQQKRFGKKWCITLAKILRDFGEVK